MPDAPRPDLDLLGEALDDHSPDGEWWYVPTTGEVVSRYDRLGLEDDEAEDDPFDVGWVRIEPTGSRDGYRDMEEFVAGLPDPSARSTLERAIVGKGAFRRFKDVLFASFPELAPSWHAFRETRVRGRAIEWLEDAGLVEPGTLTTDDSSYPARQERQGQRETELALEALHLALGRARAVAARSWGTTRSAGPSCSTCWTPPPRLRNAPRARLAEAPGGLHVAANPRAVRPPAAPPPARPPRSPPALASAPSGRRR